MRISSRLPYAAVVAFISVACPAAAQQQVNTLQQTQSQPPQAAVQGQITPQAQAQGQVQQPAVPPPVPAGFNLNAIEQGMLNQVLGAWQAKNAQINTFKCSFDRQEYNAFSPRVNNQEAPLNICEGEVRYSRPDKGSFQIISIRTFKANPPTPGQAPGAPITGDWVKDANAIGEHWVCDGKNVYEYRHHDKQLVERPIPPQLQGQAIVDGPLPFLFGADAAKLKARYWMRVEQQDNQAEVWLTALPRFQEQAADFSKCEIILDRQALLPKAMRLQLPDGSRHVYIFHIDKATVNDRFATLKSFFERPTVPWGYKRVVEQLPMAQATVPQQPAVK
jgi:TIGR03009 family protein